MASEAKKRKCKSMYLWRGALKNKVYKGKGYVFHTSSLRLELKRETKSEVTQWTN